MPGRRAKVAVVLPSTSGGISMQPPAIRLANQVGYAENTLFNVVDGTSKRPGTTTVCYVDNTSAANNNTNIRLFKIVRDENEQYGVVVGPLGVLGCSVRVFRLNTTSGAEAAVMTTDVLSALYLFGPDGNTKDALRLITVADTTFILNTAATPNYVSTARTITGNTAANPTVVTTAPGHGLSTGDIVATEGSNSTPTINGSHTITVLSGTTFSVPINVTVAGTTGTMNNSKISGQDMPQVMTRTTSPTDAVAITSNTAANPTVVTATAHRLISGQTAFIVGQVGTVNINGDQIATVTGTNTFTVPVNCLAGGGTGGTVTGRAAFSIAPATWNQRPSGDDITNPPPPIIRDNGTIGGTKSFRDIAFTRERLVLAGDSWVITSQAGDTFNLWIDDAANVVASDPVQIQVASQEAIDLDYLVPIRRSILAFTRNGRQFDISSDAEVFSQANVRVTPITKLTTLPVRPDTIDPIVYAAAANDASAQLHEIVYDDINLPTTAEDVTSHVRDLIFLKKPSNGQNATIRTIATSPQNGIVVVGRTSFNTNSAKMQDLFLYSSLFRGDAKVQSAWTRISFDGDHGIHDFIVIGNDLYLLRGHVLGGTYTTFLEKMSLSPESSHRVTE